MFHAQNLELPSYLHRASLNAALVDSVWNSYQEYLRNRKQVVTPLIRAVVEPANDSQAAIDAIPASTPTRRGSEVLPMDTLILVSRDSLGSKIDKLRLSHRQVKFDLKPYWDTSMLRYRDPRPRGQVRAIFVCGTSGFRVAGPASHTVGDVEAAGLMHCEVSSLKDLERRIQEARQPPFAW